MLFFFFCCCWDNPGDDGNDDGDDDDSSHEDDSTDDNEDEDKDLEEEEEEEDIVEEGGEEEDNGDEGVDEDKSNVDQKGNPIVIEILDNDDDDINCKAKIIAKGNNRPDQLLQCLVSKNKENMLQGISLCLLRITSEFYQKIEDDQVPNNTKINIGIPSCNVDLDLSKNGNSNSTIITKGNHGTAPLVEYLPSKANGDNKNLFDECWILLDVTEPFSNSLPQGQKLLAAHLAPPDVPNMPGGQNNPCQLYGWYFLTHQGFWRVSNIVKYYKISNYNPNRNKSWMYYYTKKQRRTTM